MLQRTPHPLDPAWIDTLYAEKFDSLVRDAYRIVGNVSQAEDVAQEAFAVLITSPPKDLGKIYNWLRTVVRHRSIDLLRESKRDQARVVPDQEVSSAEENALATIDRQKIQEALTRLSTRDAKALWLRHSGFSYQEIARIADIPENQVGVILLRAMNKLRILYSDVQRTKETPTHEYEEVKTHVHSLSGRQPLAAPGRPRH